MYYVLLLDDERNILQALNRELAKVQDEFDKPVTLSTDCYQSPADALQAAEIKSYDIAISDYRMPEINGVEFLRRFKAIQPDAVRIILSGSADITGIINAINEVEIFHLLIKPWCEIELKGAILQGLKERQRLLENRRLADVVRSGQSAIKNS